MNVQSINVEEMLIRSFEIYANFTAERNFETLDAYLNRQDLLPILQNQELFWWAYCKAVLLKKIFTDQFSISQEGKKIRFSGNKLTFEELEKFIEQFRKFFLEGFKNRQPLELLIISINNHCCLQRASPVVNLIYNCYLHDEISYLNYIQPVLSTLASFFGAEVLYPDAKKQQYVIEDFFDERFRDVSVIQITWKEGPCYDYPIEPISIQKMPELNRELYGLYQQQQFYPFFDDSFTIAFNDIDGAISSTKVHGNLLFFRCGPVLQGFLRSPMKDAEEIRKNKTLTLRYPREIVLTFIDYMYLDGEEFSKKIFSSKKDLPLEDTVNFLFTLLEFAHEYQLEGLINCCTNLISRFATKKDVATIKYWAKLLENKHLEILLDYFSPKEKTIIKV